MLIFFLKLIFYALNLVPSILFRIFCKMYSLNFICEKDSSILFSLTNLFLNGFIAAYL